MSEKPSSVLLPNETTEKPDSAKDSDAPSQPPVDVSSGVPTVTPTANLQVTEKPSSVSLPNESTEKPVGTSEVSSNAPSQPKDDVSTGAPSGAPIIIVTKKPVGVSLPNESTEKPVDTVEKSSNAPSQLKDDVSTGAPSGAPIFIVTKKPVGVSNGDGAKEKPVGTVELSSNAPSQTITIEVTENPSSGSLENGNINIPVTDREPSGVAPSDLPSSMPSITGLVLSDLPSIVSGGFSSQPSSFSLQVGSEAPTTADENGRSFDALESSEAVLSISASSKLLFGVALFAVSLML